MPKSLRIVWIVVAAQTLSSRLQDYHRRFVHIAVQMKFNRVNRVVGADGESNESSLAELQHAVSRDTPASSLSLSLATVRHPKQINFYILDQGKQVVALIHRLKSLVITYKLMRSAVSGKTCNPTQQMVTSQAPTIHREQHTQSLFLFHCRLLRTLSCSSYIEVSTLSTLLPFSRATCFRNFRNCRCRQIRATTATEKDSQSTRDGR